MALNDNPYAVGNNVYNGGSSSANQGMRLDPMGYIDRSLRSRRYTPGVAQGALNRIRPDGAQQVTGTNPVGLTPTAGPVVTSRPTGMLEYDGKRLTLNADEQTQLMSGWNQLASAQNAAQNAKNQAYVNWGAQDRDVTRLANAALRNIVSNKAGRGSLFSSGRENQETEQSNAFAQQVAELLTRLRDAYTTADQSVVDTANQYEGTKSGVALAAAERLAKESQTNPDMAPVDPGYTPPAPGTPPTPPQQLPYNGTTQPDTTTPSSNPKQPNPNVPAPAGHNNFTVQPWVKGKSYKVVKGETLASIAKKYNTTVAALIKLNNIQDPNKITSGNTIRIR